MCPECAAGREGSRCWCPRSPARDRRSVKLARGLEVRRSLASRELAELTFASASVISAASASGHIRIGDELLRGLPELPRVERPRLTYVETMLRTNRSTPSTRRMRAAYDAATRRRAGCGGGVYGSGSRSGRRARAAALPEQQAHIVSGGHVGSGHRQVPRRIAAIAARRSAVSSLTTIWIEATTVPR